jgi:long-chain acyl-CoA synthetase
MPIGYKIADYLLNKHQEPPMFWRLIYAGADLICFRPIRDYLGLKKLKVGLTGGSLLGPDTFNWFRAIGVHLGEVYGLSEAAPITAHGKDVRVGTIGAPFPGVEVKISEEGEILVKSPAEFTGYYKDPEATREKMIDGFIATGDAGIIKDGHVIYFDRLKDMLNLKSGVKYSPTYIENRLKFSQYIKDIMVGGNENEEIVYALMVIDYENVGKWAERKHIPYTTYADLSQKKEVYQLTLQEIKRVNATLPEAAKVKKYIHLPKEFDADEGELTRTRKLKRFFLEDRYGNIIKALYSGEREVKLEAEVRYRDGRKGKVETIIPIVNVEGVV